MAQESNDKLGKIVSLAKRRGFVFQGSEIYGGLAGFWDYGPLGNELKYNIEQLWWKRFVSSRRDMYGISSSTIMPDAVWHASGHLKDFTDPLVECVKCKKRFRVDHVEGQCPDCEGNLGEERQFNMMFKTNVGAVEDGASHVYFRPEIAQGMFVNFKNIVDTFHPKIPFGIAQIGKAFRNEINVRDFLFRVREFDLMEFEYFVRGEDWEKWFEYWRKEMWEWINEIGIAKDKIHEIEVKQKDRAHYSKRTIDFEYEFPFGRKELYGLAYRTDYDLKNHSKASGVDLTYKEEGKDSFVPHVIEPTFGVGRTVLAVLSESYDEDELNGEKRVVLRLKPHIAPIKAAVFPLMRNKPELVKKAEEIFDMLKKEIPQILWDDNGNIGKRYRRQDEIGTPSCVTIDFETLEDDSVTVRDRDTGKQERVTVKDLTKHLKNIL